MVSRVDLPKSQLRERRRRRRMFLVALAAGSVILLLAAIVGATWLPFMRVKQVSVMGTKTVMPEKLQASVLHEIAGAYAFVFAKSNILLYPRSTIEHNLLQQFPILGAVNVHAENFHTIAVVVTERQPAALWCGESLASSTSSCYLLDKTGTIYAPAVVYSGDAYQKYFGPTTGGALPQQFLTPAEFHSLSVLVDSLQGEQHLTMQSISVDAVNDVRVMFSNDFELVFALNSDSGDLFDRFSLALMADPFVAHKLSDFQYLDLRFGDKLYYKLKSGVVATTTQKKK